MNNYILTSSSTISIGGTVYTYYGTNNMISHPYRFNNESASPNNAYTDDVISNSVQCWDSTGASIGLATTNCNIYAYSVATLDEAADIGEVSRPSTGGNKCIISGIVDTYGCKIVTSPSVVYDTIYHCVNYVDLEKKEVEPTEYTYRIDLYPYKTVQGGTSSTSFKVYEFDVKWDNNQIPSKNDIDNDLNIQIDTTSLVFNNIGTLEQNGNTLWYLYKIVFTLTKNTGLGPNPITNSWMSWHHGKESDMKTTNGTASPIKISTDSLHGGFIYYVVENYSVDKSVTITHQNTSGITIKIIFTLHY